VRSTHIKVDIMSLPDTMMAVVVHGKEDYRMEEVPVPRPGPGEVLVKVEAVGICAGDAKTFTGAERFWGNGADVPQYVEPPVIPGHEFSGRVVALGEGAAELHGVAIGDLTVSESAVLTWSSTPSTVISPKRLTSCPEDLVVMCILKPLELDHLSNKA